MFLNRQAAREIGNTDLTQGLLQNNTNGPRVIHPGRPGSSMNGGDHDHGCNSNKGAKGSAKGSGAKGAKGDGDESGNKRRKNLTIVFTNLLFS